MRFLRRPAVMVNSALIVFFSIFLVTALGFRPLVGAVPTVVATLGLILSLVSLAGEVLPNLGKGLEAGYFNAKKKVVAESAPEGSLPQSTTKPAVLLGCICGSFILITLVGFLIGAPVSIFAYTKWVSNMSWLKSLLMGVGICLFMLVLRIAMGLILFPGILFGGIIT